MADINGVYVDKYHSIDDRLDGRMLSRDLGKWLFQSWQNKRTLAETLDLCVSEDWEGVGVLMGSDGSPYPVDHKEGDYGLPYYGGAHLCQMALWVANGDIIRKQLTERFNDGESDVWHVGDHTLFYNLGNAGMVAYIRETEEGLADYPSLDDMRYSEVEDRMARECFEDAYGRKIPDELMDAAFREFTENSTGCPECGTKGIGEVMVKLGYVQCSGCDEWVPDGTLTEHPDEEDRMLCGDCL